MLEVLNREIIGPMWQAYWVWVTTSDEYWVWKKYGFCVWVESMSMNIEYEHWVSGLVIEYRQSWWVSSVRLGWALLLQASTCAVIWLSVHLSSPLLGRHHHQHRLHGNHLCVSFCHEYSWFNQVTSASTGTFTWKKWLAVQMFDDCAARFVSLTSKYKLY